jgi:hypothetical protein
MFARNVEGVETGLCDNFVGVVELLRLGHMTDIARMDHEGGPIRQCIDLHHGLLKHGHRIGICRPFKTDVAVGNLQECEAASRLRPGF